jgi:hypothetical protein
MLSREARRRGSEIREVRRTSVNQHTDGEGALVVCVIVSVLKPMAFADSEERTMIEEGRIAASAVQSRRLRQPVLCWPHRLIHRSRPAK